MQTIANLSMFSLMLTLLTFEAGRWLQKKLRSPLCNPILISVVLVIGILLLFRIPVEDYQAGAKLFSWLLTPATICLAVPLYDQLQILKKNLPAICAGVVAGTLVSLGSIGILCVAFRLDSSLTASLLPKSITTAMGIAVSAQMGGISAISTVVIIVTGILGSVFGSMLCRLFHITDPIAQGVAFGTASHVIGTSRASQISELSGAVSSLSLVIAGVLTAVLCPMVFSLL